MIPPAPADLEIPARVALFHKSRALNQRQRGDVAGLNVCFEPMQFQFRKRVAKHERDGLGRITLAREIRADLVTEISVLKSTANNLTQTDRTEDRAVCPATNKKP